MRYILFLFLLSLFFIYPISGQAVTVGPDKLDYSVNPGEIIEGQFFLKNDTNETQTFYPDFQKFTEVNGEKVFLKEKSDLADWIEIESSVTLGPSEQINVPFKIIVPQDAPPGGHFAIVWWGSTPSTGGGPVAIAVRAGVVLLLRVSGDVLEQGKILSFESVNSKKIFWSSPAAFKATFANDGNVHLKPTGHLAIKNIFGKTVEEIIINPHSLQVLPHSQRIFEGAWTSPRFAFGLYKAQVNLAFGESRKEASAAVWFFLFPLKTIVPAFLILVLVVLVIPRMIKKYNQWIIKKAGLNKPAISEKPEFLNEAGLNKPTKITRTRVNKPKITEAKTRQRRKR